eukprot:TRINITY_DN20223_c0_g1_i1.p1 TRINITY_DN20223_c0_g1~~TRINITY_DN20223_c0_g1_i1.p1  ORF type:complete len:406 (-),score=49.18 TRINITY_DN20223_c0_g1_i1:8-1225(-)
MSRFRVSSCTFSHFLPQFVKSPARQVYSTVSSPNSGFSGFELTVLGTASGAPSTKRGLSGSVLRLDGCSFLFDAGEGTQVQLLRSPAHVSTINNVFITHLHLDHVGGLTGLLSKVQYARSAANRHPIDVYGPVGLRRLFRTNERITSMMPPSNGQDIPIRIHELVSAPDTQPSAIPRTGERNIASSDESVWNLIDDGKYTVTASPLRHRRVPCFGYVVKEKDKLGTLDMARLLSLGVEPGRILRRIKSGDLAEFQLPNGTMVKSADFVSPGSKGRKAAILGDTSDSSAIMASALDCDLLQHEATLPDALADQAMPIGHSTPKMAAIFAQSVRAKRLVLTHFGARWGDFSEVNEDTDDAETDSSQLLVPMNMSIAAQPMLLNKYFDGEVIVASDLCTVQIPQARGP